MVPARFIALACTLALSAAASAARGDEPAPGQPAADAEGIHPHADGGYSQGSFSAGAGVAVAANSEGVWGAGFSPSLRLQGIDVGGPGIAVIADLHARAIWGGLSGDGRAFGGGAGGIDFSLGYTTSMQGCGFRIGGAASIEYGQFSSEGGDPVRTADTIDIARLEPGLLCHDGATTFFVTPFIGLGIGTHRGYSTHVTTGVESRLWVLDEVSAHASAAGVLPVRLSTFEADGALGEGPRIQGEVGVDVRVAERVFGGTSDLTLGVALQGQTPIGGGGAPAGFVGAASAGFTF